MQQESNAGALTDAGIPAAEPLTSGGRGGDEGARRGRRQARNGDAAGLHGYVVGVMLNCLWLECRCRRRMLQ